MKIFFQIILFIFPWKIRRFLLVKFLKYEIAPSARIGYSILMSKHLIMAELSYIGNFTICRKIDLLQLKNSARLGTFNYITGFPTTRNDFFSHVLNRKCELIIGEHSAITSRHFIDCTAGIYLGKFTTFAGIRSQILTHSINLELCIQDAESVYIGDYCFVGTGCVFLKGTKLPDYSVLGAASLLNKAYHELGCLYGGVPAKKISTIDINQYQFFSRKVGSVK